MYSGQCVGGPLNGQTIQSRFPKGFLLVNRPAAEIAIYEWKGDHFEVRTNGVGGWRMNEVTDTNERKNRYRAALEPNYDVLAYDPEEMSAWE